MLPIIPRMDTSNGRLSRAIPLIETSEPTVDGVVRSTSSSLGCSFSVLEDLHAVISWHAVLVVRILCDT